jgi:hypothetical protein
MLTGLNFRLPFSETGPTFPLSQLSTARHWQDAESMITERWQSGRSRRTRNAVGRKVPGVRIPPSPPSFALWASDGTANFAKHKILAGRHRATAKDALRSLGGGGSSPLGFGWHGQLQSAHYARAHSAVFVLMRAQDSTVQR